MSAKIINLQKRKFFLFGKKEVVVIIFAIVFTTLGIKAADTLMGNDSLIKSGDDICPKEMVLIPFAKGDFCLDIYEASAQDDCSYVDPESQTETRINLDDPGCVPVSLKGNIPWRNISQDQASRACAKAGKRLATNQEWLQASQGTPDLLGGWEEIDCQVDSNWKTQPGLSGTGDQCISSFGAYDMIGNVWEWVEGVVKDGEFEGERLPMTGYIDSTNGQAIPGETNQSKANPDYNNDYFWLKTKGLRGMVRGGYWNNKSDAGVYSLYAVTPPSSVESGIGFRCVK
jgi:formylglycine-generating enzyme required for sulfatase activity